MWWLRAGTRGHPLSKSDTGSSGLAFLAPQGLGDRFGVPRIVLHFGLGDCLQGETPFGPHLAWPWAGGSRWCPPVCHAPCTALGAASQKADAASSKGGDSSSLGAVVWCVSQEGSRGWKQLRRGQEQHGGTRSSGLGDGAVVTHPFPPGSQLSSGMCRQGFSLPTVCCL